MSKKNVNKKLRLKNIFIKKENKNLIRETKKTMNNGERNMVLSLNKSRLGDVDPSKVSRINL